MFTKPENPFVLVYHIGDLYSDNYESAVAYFETEDEARDYISGYKDSFSDDFEVDEFFEIGCSRDIIV